VERLKQQPGLGPAIRLIETWPRVTAWIVLSLGCVILLVYEARDVGLTTGNWIALIVATIAVAGLCIWIISWEDEDESAPPAEKQRRADTDTAADNPEV
jgi:K+ transporter